MKGGQMVKSKKSTKSLHPNSYVQCAVHVHQSAEDQQYISQHGTSCTVYQAVHQSAEDKQYVSQQRTSSTSVSREPAVHQSAEDQQYVSQQRTSSTSASRERAVNQPADDKQETGDLKMYREKCNKNVIKMLK